MRNPYISLLKTSWTYANPAQRIKIVCVYSMFFFSFGMMGMMPFLYGWFINAIQSDAKDIIRYVWQYAGMYMGLVLFQWLLHKPARIMERALAFQISENFINIVFHQLLRLPIDWHKDHHSGSVVNRIKKAHVALRHFFESGFLFFQTIIQVLISTIVIFFFSPLFGTIVIAIGLVTLWINYKFDKPVVKSINDFNEKEHKVSATLSDIISNIVSVITLRLEKLTEKEMNGQVKQMFPPYQKLTIVGEWKWFSLSILVVLMYLVTIIGYTYTHYESGKIFYLGGLVTLIGFVNQFTATFFTIGSQYTVLIQHCTDIQSVQTIKDAYQKMNRNETSTLLTANWSSIKILDLNFTYSKKDFLTDNNNLDIQKARLDSKGLYNVDLLLTRGKRIAIIGESGGGKSTLLALLRGLYQPSGVRVIVNDKEVCALQGISDMVTLFPQDPEIFENTIRYNITLGLPFTEEEISKACDTACFTDVLNKLPGGLETNIHEKGINLSGGQKQRLALVRGLLAAVNSDIVLLDEPTNRVDSKTEQEIFKRLFKSFNGKTVVCSVHNLNLLNNFDYVYLIRDGRITESGVPGNFVHGWAKVNV